MKKITLLSTSLIMAVALMAVPFNAFAGDCASKAKKTSADATMINSEAANQDMATSTGKDCTASKTCVTSSACTGSKATMIGSDGKACTTSKTSMTNAQGKSCTMSGKEIKSADANMNTNAKYATATFSVKGMTCTGCEQGLTTKLTKTDGVNEVLEVSYKSNKAVLIYDPAKVSADDLAKAINKMGYEANYVVESNKSDSEKM